MLPSKSLRLITLASLALLVSMLGGYLMTHPAFATSCGGVDTSIISGDICNGADVKSTDSADNPVVSILVFVIQVLTGAVGVAAVGTLIYAGILYSAAGGDSGQVQKAKTIIKDTVIGIVCYAGMILILNFVIPGGVFGQQSTTGGGTSASPGDGGSNNDPTTTLPLSLTTWNVLKMNSSAKVISGLKTILEASDIVGIQEAGPFAKAISIQIACSSCKYSMFPAANVAPRKVAIIWQKDKFDILDKGYSATATEEGVKKYVVWMKLQEKTSKKVFYILNTHVPFGAGEGPGFTTDKSKFRLHAIAAYKDHMTNTVAMLKKFQKDNLPIFFTGDFAANYRLDDCSNKYFPCQAFSHDLNLKSGWEYTKLSGIGKSTGTIADSTRIPDYVFSWNLDYITYQSNTARGGSGNGWSGSDHKPVTLMLTIGAKK